jgi:hypothetical protein
LMVGRSANGTCHIAAGPLAPLALQALIDTYAISRRYPDPRDPNPARP